MDTRWPNPEAAALERWHKHKEEWVAAACKWHDKVEGRDPTTPEQLEEHWKRMIVFEAASGRLWQVYRDLLK